MLSQSLGRHSVDEHQQTPSLPKIRHRVAGRDHYSSRSTPRSGAHSARIMVCLLCCWAGPIVAPYARSRPYCGPFKSRNHELYCLISNILGPRHSCDYRRYPPSVGFRLAAPESRRTETHPTTSWGAGIVCLLPEGGQISRGPYGAVTTAQLATRRQSGSETVVVRLVQQIRYPRHRQCHGGLAQQTKSLHRVSAHRRPASSQSL